MHVEDPQSCQMDRERDVNEEIQVVLPYGPIFSLQVGARCAHKDLPMHGQM